LHLEDCKIFLQFHHLHLVLSLQQATEESTEIIVLTENAHLPEAWQTVFLPRPWLCNYFSGTKRPVLKT